MKQSMSFQLNPGSGLPAYLQLVQQVKQALRMGILDIGDKLPTVKEVVAEVAVNPNTVMKAYKTAKELPDGGRLIKTALQQATSVPLKVAERAAAVVEMVAGLRPITNPNMSSDLTTATALARAALTGALANVEINLESIKPESPEDEAFVRGARGRAAALKA